MNTQPTLPTGPLTEATLNEFCDHLDQLGFPERASVLARILTDIAAPANAYDAGAVLRFPRFRDMVIKTKKAGMFHD